MSRITNAIRIIDSRVRFFLRLISRVHSASGGQNPRLEKSILLVAWRYRYQTWKAWINRSAWPECDLSLAVTFRKKYGISRAEAVRRAVASFLPKGRGRRFGFP